MSSSSSVTNVSASSTSEPRAGLLFVTTSVKDSNLKAQVLNDWYDEHSQDCLNSPGNGGLFLRYTNLDETIGSHEDLGPSFTTRVSADSTGNEIRSAGWPYLALVKLTNVEWLKSKEFDDMPRVSKLLPPGPNGSLGSAFDAFHAGLRSFETVGEIPDQHRNKGRPRWLIALQLADAEPRTFEELDSVFVKGNPTFRCATRYRSIEGYLEYQEPGRLPAGLAMYQYEGDKAPQLSTDAPVVVRQDNWELFKEAGDLSLDL